MSYTLSELIQLQTQILATDLDNYLVEPDDAQQTRQINLALQWLSRAISITDERIRLALTPDSPIQVLRAPGVCSRFDDALVPVRVVKPLVVVINGNPLQTADASDYGLWSRVEVERRFPSWRTDTSGTPTKAAYLGNGRLLLHRPPSATVAGYEHNYLAATVLAPDLAEPDDVPDIPEELHFAVAQMAAVLSAEPTATEAEGWRRLEALRNSPAALIRRIRDENLRANAPWGASSVDPVRLMPA